MSVIQTTFLFSYGTLQLESVQLKSFGRRLVGRADSMPGFRKSFIEITDPDVLASSGEQFHPIVVPSDDPDDAVDGTVFEITAAELHAADQYEVADYKRVDVVLRSGTRAWVYVKAGE
ncbi:MULTISPECIES: gamma-glutamylcyclotransferase family protein [unclassified Bradyrhizobium]|uniref:gamma-glutamylcyclotransferase family protein n=1 Tax=unclassified Bradyrhizobium TaxID=2631580 RepID=UPI0028E7D042|nr:MULTISPECIES: gamma-glutamylcyclotransferase family protein [unclassified Bradyrhizobium]